MTTRFEFDRADPKAQYYEILDDLMERWEHEIVEFKEAKGQYNTDKAGQYFSAISNEANLKSQQYGWFVMGVSESKNKHPVGTHFKQEDPALLEKFKHEIAQGTSDGATYLDIIELTPVYQGKSCRVLMFKIPAAAVAMPTAWKNHYYGRDGESLVPLAQVKIDIIRNQERMDWSKQVLEGAGIQHLDSDAIQLARGKYLEKMNRSHIAEELSALSDADFLRKIKLMQGDNVTNAAMLLLGNPDYDYLFPSPPEIMWRLFGSDGSHKDYQTFTIPFISVVDKLFGKIRNLTYRYMPNQQTLFPTETQQYDMWMLRELLNNCIAHTSYRAGNRIYLDEYEDQIVIKNPGNFLPGSIETVLRPGYNPPYYKNQLLATSMVNFNMIDTQSSGIQKVYRIQRDKYFPLPDYGFANNWVEVRVYGKVLNETYMHILFHEKELPLDAVFLLDRVQKGILIDKEAAGYLRKYNLIEGRYPKIFPSAHVAQEAKDAPQYIRNKAFDDQYYKDMIVGYLKKYERGKKADFRTLLMDKLSDILTDEQKEKKISNLLNQMRKDGIIKQDSANHRKACWVLC